MARSDYGHTELELGENIYTLEPTLKALQRINRNFGNLRNAIKEVRDLNLDALVFVIREGANLNNRETEDLQEDLFASGPMAAYGPVQDYLMALLNPSGKEESEEEGKRKSRRSPSKSRSMTSSNTEPDG